MLRVKTSEIDYLKQDVTSLNKQLDEAYQVLLNFKIAVIEIRFNSKHIAKLGDFRSMFVACAAQRLAGGYQ